MFEPRPPDGDTSFKFPVQCKMLRVMGLWPLERCEPNLTLLGMMYRVLAVVSFMMTFLTTVGQLLYITHNLDQMLAVTDGFCTLLTGMHGCYRIFHMFVHRRLVKQIVEEFVRDIWISKKNHKFIHEVCEGEGLVMLLVTILFAMLIIMFITLPLIEIFNHPDMTNKPFPYKMWFPFDTDDPPLKYGVLYIFTSWAGVCAVCSICSTDSLFCYLVVHTCGQLKLLRKNIDDLVTISEDTVRSKATEDNTEEDIIMRISDESYVLLCEYIRRHVVIIEFSKRLDNVLGFMLLVNFLVSSFLICVVGFQMVAVKMSVFELLKMVVYIASSLTQLFVLCWYGDKLIDQSERISNSLYLSGWHTVPFTRLGGCILLPLQRSQKPLCITAWKFSVLSLNTFTTLLSSSMSYFTLLQTLLESE